LNYVCCVQFSRVAATWHVSFHRQKFQTTLVATFIFLIFCMLLHSMKPVCDNLWKLLFYSLEDIKYGRSKFDKWFINLQEILHPLMKSINEFISIFKQELSCVWSYEFTFRVFDAQFFLNYKFVLKFNFTLSSKTFFVFWSKQKRSVVITECCVKRKRVIISNLTLVSFCLQQHFGKLLLPIEFYIYLQ
jgi:hypothetical protein